MHKIIAGIGVIASALAALSIGYMFFGLLTDGFDNGSGMAILAFQLYGLIFAGLGILLGVLARFLGGRTATGPSAAAKWAIIIGLLAGLSVFAAYIFLG